MDASPPANVRAFLMVMALSPELKTKSLEEIAGTWRDRVEDGIVPDDRKTGTDKLGGRECFRADVRGTHGAAKTQLKWRLARNGARA